MKTRLLIAVLAAGAFVLGYGAIAKAYYPASPWWQRASMDGYFDGGHDTKGDLVFPSNYNPGLPACTGDGSLAVPLSVGSPDALRDFLKCKLDHGNTREKTGASFIILTMLKVPGPQAHNNRITSSSDPRIQTWYDNVLVPLQNQGAINWNYKDYPYTMNSLYQGCCGFGNDPNDDTFYGESSTKYADSITFSSGGTVVYAIKRYCSNPVGDANFVGYPWQGLGYTTVAGGGNPATGGADSFAPHNITVNAGTTVTFQHYIKNVGQGAGGDIWFRIDDREGTSMPWEAEYFSNTNLTGTPVKRSEALIDYRDASGNSPPIAGIPANGFSARWTKTQTFPAGTYNFTMKVDDGGRLKIDGNTVLNAWIDQGATPYNYSITWGSSGSHTIVMEYKETGGAGFATLDYTNRTRIGGQNSGWYQVGQIKHNELNGLGTPAGTVNVTIPANAQGGSQYCQRVLWSWKNQWGGGDNGLGTDGYGDLACVTVAANFNLVPNVTARVGGVAVSTAEVGQQIEFSFAVNNTADVSTSVGCTIYGLTKNGAYTAPNPADSTSDPGYTPPATGCPRTFPAGNTPLTTQLVTVGATDFNKTICRSLYVNPATAGGSALGAEACVQIVAKPYTRVFGGDVSVGRGVADSAGACTSNANAAVIGWNQRSAAAWAGAGTQYATFALHRIFDFGSTLGNATGGPNAANRPAGLSFANAGSGVTVNVNNGSFGGSFGTLQCIPNYFGAKPSGTLPPVPANVNGMATGTYSTNTGTFITLGGGSVDGGERISVYVDGDVYITSNITYGGNWSVATMPLFHLIVKGNIYIDNDVSRLDGLYVAQRAGSTGGTIYTCTTGAAALEPTDPAFYDNCNNQKLTVAGALVANQIQFGRTAGTVSNSTASETAASGAMAEAINYGPIMWIPQAAGIPDYDKYDAVTSLPPIL